MFHVKKARTLSNNYHNYIRVITIIITIIIAIITIICNIVLLLSLLTTYVTPTLLCVFKHGWQNGLSIQLAFDIDHRLLLFLIATMPQHEA